MHTRVLVVLVGYLTLAACDPCGSQSTYDFNLFTGGMVWHPDLHYPGSAVTSASQGSRVHYLWTYKLDNVCRQKPVEVTFLAGLSAQLAALGPVAEGRFATAQEPPPAAPVPLSADGTNVLTGVTEWSSAPGSLDLGPYFDDDTPAWVQYTLDVSLNAALPTKTIQDNNLIPYLKISSTYSTYASPSP